jgi:MFS family permease
VSAREAILPGCLRERSFVLLLGGSLVSIIGDAFVLVALPFAILALGGSAGEIGLVLAARAIPNAIFLLVGGVWADRLPRRLVMLSTDLVRAVVTGLVVLALVTDRAGIAVLVILMVVFGVAEAFFRPAFQGVVPQTVSDRNLQQAYGLIAMTPALGIAVGGAAGGLTVAVLGSEGAFLLVAIAFVVAASFFAFMTTRPGGLNESRESFLKDLRSGWHEFSSRTWLVVCVIGEGLYALFVMPVIYAIGPLIAEDAFDGPASWGYVLSGFGVGFLVGGLIAMRIRPRRPIVFAYLISVPFAGFLALLSVPATLALIIVGAVVGGATIAISGTLLETTITREVALEVRSRVGSFRTLGSVALLPIGMVLIGTTVATLGTSGAVVLGAFAVLVNVAIVVATPSVRRLYGRYPEDDDGGPADGSEPAGVGVEGSAA